MEAFISLVVTVLVCTAVIAGLSFWLDKGVSRREREDNG